MPRHLRFLSLALLVLCAGVPPAQAALKVLATTPDWGSLVNELGGDKVNVYTATSPFQDVHRVDAKPSVLARARSGELFFVTGEDVEIGWMPEMLQVSSKSRIQPGAPGSIEAAALVTKLTATPPKMILRNAYIDPRAAEWLAERIHVPVVLLPYTVGGTPEAKDLFGLFDDTLKRLLAANQ